MRLKRSIENFALLTEALRRTQGWLVNTGEYLFHSKQSVIYRTDPAVKLYLYLEVCQTNFHSGANGNIKQKGKNTLLTPMC